MPAIGTFAGGSARAYGRGTSAGLPVTLGLIGFYTLSSVTASQWQDTSGSGNHATLGGGAGLATVAPGNGATNITQVLTGTSTSHTVQWPAAILPSTGYTLFHVTRYTGVSNARIYTSSNTNWLSGHWGGLSGQYYQNGWLTNNVTSYYANNWFITTDQINNVRTNGITRGTAGGSSAAQMSINIGYPAEVSTFQTVECIVYNRVLSAAEYGQVESYLASKFGITLNT